MYLCISKFIFMQAFLLAAGLGTRLRPLTDHKPKALVEIQGVPLLKINLDNLIRQGVSRIVVNVHHHADMIVDYLNHHTWDAEILVSDERDQLLDTGGGLKKAAHLFAPNEPVLIHNVDILSHIDLTAALKQHSHSMSIATLLVSSRNTSRQLLFDEHCQLVGWKDSRSGETRWVQEPTPCEERAFSGIAIIEPTLLDLLPPANRPYPIIPAYLDMARNHRINYFEHKKEDWLDVGKPDTLNIAQTWSLS